MRLFDLNGEVAVNDVEVLAKVMASEATTPEAKQALIDLAVAVRFIRPSRDMADWVRTKDGKFKCSKCGAVFDEMNDYCGYCGSGMEECED